MDIQLRMLVQDYLADNKPLRKLQSRLVDITWDLRDQVSPECLRFADQASALIAEYTGGYMSEEELRELLREIAAPLFPVLSVEWGARYAPSVSTGQGASHLQAHQAVFS